MSRTPRANTRTWVILACAWLTFSTACGGDDSAPDEIVSQPGSLTDLRTVAGARARVVWVQHDGTDTLAQSDGLVLMGLDTDDGRGERPIFPSPANYTKPLLTPDGGRVIYSRRPTTDIHLVNFDGTGARRVADGFALAMWTDPASGEVWLYAGRDRVEDAYRRVVRFPLEHPDREELVWDKTLVGEDSFQLSRDGRSASGMFPWPDVGVAQLPNGAFQRLGDGCWTAMAALDRPVCWYLDGAHRNLTLVDLTDNRRWRVTIGGAPGVDGAEVYHPRWLNDPRLLAITGPFNLGGANQVRGGGPQVEVFIGRFSADYATVEAWAQVTRNTRGDAYPDAWIDPAGRTPPASPAAPSTGAAPPAPNAGRIEIEARLATPGAIPSPRAIQPYRHALVVNVYDVVRVIDGRYAHAQVLVAEWAIRDGRVLPEARKTPGSAATLRLDLYDAHPELEGERLVMDPALPPGLPVYYAVR